MYRKALNLIACASISFLFCQCVTTEETAGARNPPITVDGTLFYPDDSDQTYIVPAGSEIIGAGGKNCRFVVQNGGRMTAHSGTDNTYKIEAGGAFKGFDHPATNCRIQYHNGANIEKVNEGKGVSFDLAP